MDDKINIIRDATNLVTNLLPVENAMSAFTSGGFWIVAIVCGAGLLGLMVGLINENEAANAERTKEIERLERLNRNMFKD